MRNLLINSLLLFILAVSTSFGISTDPPLSMGANGIKNTVSDKRVTDVYAPTFSNCPSNIDNIMPNSGDCTAVVTWTPPTATGSGTVTVTSNYDPGDAFYPGSHRVIYRATDSSGTSFCEFKVTVIDNQAPIVTVPANIVTDVDPGSCTALVTFPNPSGSDNCPAGTGESPLEQDFTDNGGSPENFSTQCYELVGTKIGSSGAINGSDELETLALVTFDTRKFTMPITNFNGSGEIFFDHKITAGIPGVISDRARLTVALINTSGVETVIFTEDYVDENVQTEYIPIVQSGDFYVRFAFDTNKSDGDIAFLDNIYIPGFVTADESASGLCARNLNRVIKIDASGLGSGSQFPVGTTTLRYFMEDAVGNITFKSFDITVNNNINPPNGSDVEYCEGEPVPQLSVSVGPGETADWYDTPSGGNLLQANSSTYTPPGPGTYYAETKNTTTGCVSASRTPINVTENPKPNPPSAPSPIEYCIGDPATQLTATGDPGNMVLWYDAPTGGTMYASAPTPDTSVAGTTSYYVEQVDASTGCISDRTQVDVIVYALPLAPTVNTPVEYCIGDTAAELNDSAAGSNLRWYDAATGRNEIPGTTRPNTSTAGQQFFWVTQSAASGGTTCESTRSQLTVNVNAPPAITSQPTSQSVCENENATLAVGASDANTFQWQLFDGTTWNDLTDTAPYSNTGTNTMTVTGATPSLNGNQYRAVASSPAASCADALSNSVTLTVNAAPSDPTSGGDQTECAQNPIQTLTATATPPSGATVVWYDAVSGGNIVANPILDAVGTVTYYAESVDDGTSGGSTSRTPVTLTIEAVPAAPTTSGDQTECEASPTQTMTATATAPVGAAVVWYDAGSGGNTVGSPILNSMGTVTYYAESRTSGSGCVSTSRTPVTLTMNATPTIAVTPASQSCSPDLTTYSISVDVNRGTVSSSEGTVTDNGSNNWKISGVTSGNNITVTVTDANTCSENIAINAPNCGCPSVNAPASGGDHTECETNPIQTLTATATPPSGASVVWYDTATNGTIVGSPTWSSEGAITYYAESVDNVNSCTSATRTPVTLTIQGAPVAPTSDGDQTECEAIPTQTLTATATPVAGTNIIWYDAASGGNTVADPILDTVGSVTYFAESQDNSTPCISFNRVKVTLTLHALPIVVANATATNINAGDPVTLTGSGTDSYAWDNGVSDGDTVFPLTTTTYTVIGTDANACENTDSVTIIVSATSDIRLEKTVDNASPNVGDTVTFILTATNDGPSNDLGGILVSDVLPVGYMYSSDKGNATNGSYDSISGDWALPALNNGNSVSMTILATVNAPTGAANEYLSIAQVISATNYDNDSTPNNDDGDQSEDDEAAVSITPQEADLEVNKSISQATANPGDTLTLTVDVINNGPNNATNVCVENIVPDGFTVTTVNNGGILTENTILWSGIDILNGTTTTLTFDVTVNIPANTANEYLNTVQVTTVDQYDSDSVPNNDDGDQSEDDEDNAEIVLIPADLSLTKELNATSNQNPNAGDTVTFALTLTNAGPGLATNVTLEDVVPSGYNVGAINNGGVQSGNTITWNVPSLSVGSLIFTYEATINAPANVLGEYTNTAQVITSDQFDPNSSPNNDDGDQSEDDEARYTINAPTVDIEINKTVDKSQTFHGDTLVFTVAATNNSTYDATNIGVEDVLPSGYTLVSHKTNVGAFDEMIATWEIPLIAKGETAILEMTVTVTETEDYINIAELIYVDQIDPNITNDRAEVTPEITQEQCLTVFNEFSPNDDGANDVFFIECIEQYPNSLLQVYNRWGNEVFAAKGYDNSWDGTMVKKSTLGTYDKLPVGTYYYTLEPGDGNAQAKSGWLYISR